MTFTRPSPGDPLSSTGGKSQTLIVTEIEDMLEADDARITARTSSHLNVTDPYSDIAEVVVNSCEATTGWYAINNDTVDGNPGPSLSTQHNVGTYSVQAYMNHPSGAAATSLYVNLTEAGYASGLTTKAGQYLLFDIMVESTVILDLRSFFNHYSLFAATAPDIGGTVITQQIETMLALVTLDWREFGEWYTFALPVGALTNIKSMGLTKTSTTGGVNMRARIHLDNLRLSSMTPLDQAYYNQTSVAALMPAGYATGVTQYPLQASSSKSVLDVRTGYTGPNRVRYLREFMLDETGTNDITTQFQVILNAAQVGDYFMGAPGATYRMERPVYIRTQGVTIDGNWSTFYATTNNYGANDTAFFNIQNADVTIRRMKIVGFRLTGPNNGSSMVSFAGTPTVSGTTYTLTSLNDEVCLIKNTTSTPVVFNAYGRDQLGRQRFDFVLSDSAHTASDCQILIKDEAGNTLQTTTLTLTGTPTTTTVYWTPIDVFARVNVTVKKATSATNTITITSFSRYQLAAFILSTEFNDGVRVFSQQVGSSATRQAGHRAVLEDLWIEGVGGTGFTVNTDTPARAPNNVRVRRVVIVANGMTGFDFDGGANHTGEDIVSIFSGRHGCDFEPEGATHAMRGLRLRNIRFWKPILQAIDYGGEARVHDVEFDGLQVDMDYAMGYIVGTVGEKATIRNARFFRSDNPADASIVQAGNHTVLGGIDLTLENIEIDGGIDLKAGTVTDENLVDHTCSGALLHNIHFRRPVSMGYLDITMAGVHLDGIFQLASDDAAGINTALPVSPIGLAPDTTFNNVRLGAMNVSLPGSYKGIAIGDAWFPGGLNLKADPLYGAQSLSGSTTKGYNLRGVGASIVGGSTSATVVFPSPSYPDPVSLAVSGTTGGVLSTSTTYYYRVAARTAAGPRLPLGEKTVATGSNTAATLTITGLYDTVTTGTRIEGFTIYRGTTSNTYDTRYDIFPRSPFAGASNVSQDKVLFKDLGTTIVAYTDLQNNYGLTFPYTAQSGSFTPVDESGWEPDTSYGAWVSPNYATTTRVSTKRRDGFDVTLGTAGPGTEPTVAFEATGFKASATDANVYTTAAFTPPANSILVLAVLGPASAGLETPTITDSAGLTWTTLTTATTFNSAWSFNTYVSTTVGGSPASMTVTATYVAQRTAGLMHLYEVTASGGVVQSKGAVGTTGTASVTMSSPPVASSYMIAFAGSIAASTAPGSWTRDKDSTVTPPVAYLDSFHLNSSTQSIAVGGTGGSWAAALIEIAADASVTGKYDWLVVR